MAGLLSFPNPVNETAARFVAGVVAVASAITLLSGWYWLIVPIAYGFVARVLTGPSLSPLGWFATKVAAPRLGAPVYVAGPPKRFAQGMGAVCTVAAALFALVLGWHEAAAVLLAVIAVFATLEAAFGLCVGCRIFGLLMAIGVVPAQTCAACADLGMGRAEPIAGGGVRRL